MLFWRSRSSFDAGNPVRPMARSPASRDEILAAARRVIDREGWPAASADKIAREAGLSRVTLHRHGLTREVILAELGEQATLRYREAMWPVLTSTGPADQRLEQALATLCNLAEENLRLLLALDAAANATVFHESADEEAMTRSVFTEPLERLLRDGAAEGTLAAVEDPAETATVLFNLVGWTYIHLRSGHRWPPARARVATLAIALRGVLGG